MVDLEFATELKIKIYNNNGSIIQEEKPGYLKKGNHVLTIPLDIKKYPQGIYFMEFTYGDKKHAMRFLVAQ
jgi:hypothetical protein